MKGCQALFSGQAALPNTIAYLRDNIHESIITIVCGDSKGFCAECYPFEVIICRGIDYILAVAGQHGIKV